MPRTPREVIIRKLKAIKRHAEWAVKHTADILTIYDEDYRVEWPVRAVTSEIGFNATKIMRLVDEALKLLDYKPRNVGGRGGGQEA